MNSTDQTNQTFIIISLFLIGIVIIFQIIQFFIWLIVVLKTKQIINKSPFYEEILLDINKNCQVQKVKLTFKFLNYKQQKNILNLKNRDFQETTAWNVYQSLSSILVVKWRNENRKHNHIFLPLISWFFYLGVINTIICALLFYLPTWTNTSSNLDQTILGIFIFLGLLILTLSWLFWTMYYEKFRKELMELAKNIDAKTFKIIKKISLFKSLFPGSDLFF